VAPDGTPTVAAPAVVLTRPTSILVGEALGGGDYALWVTNFGVGVGAGQVLKITP
jgi:hypothetical protein